MKFLLNTMILWTLMITNASAKEQKIDVAVTEKGFEPSTIKVSANDDVTLSITRKTNATCARDILFKSKNIKKELPLNKAVDIKLGKLNKGEVNFSCGMDMVTGVINVQ